MIVTETSAVSPHENSLAEGSEGAHGVPAITSHLISCSVTQQLRNRMVVRCLRTLGRVTLTCSLRDGQRRVLAEEPSCLATVTVRPCSSMRFEH